ncbi:MAG: biopolymer transporter ExbD [Candidatus Omnitrophica bacterium]|nr:biopolymer transporter ExbD [Candidatus Omnitrophota bacterium]
MKISGQRDYLVSLESVAMTDIVLNMFIFFFISFSLLYTFSPYRIKKLEVNLPEASSAKPIKNMSEANITINNEGLVYLDKELVTKKELKEKINIMHKGNPELEVVLNSDRLVQFRNIVGILDILNELGIKNLNIAATSEE